MISATDRSAIIRLLGYASEPDDITTVQSRLTIAEADASCEKEITTLLKWIRAIEKRVETQWLPVPHAKGIYTSVVLAHEYIRQIATLLALPVKANSIAGYSPDMLKYLAQVASPGEVPFISLPAKLFEHCILKEEPIESSTMPKYPAKGQYWRDTTNNETWIYDGLYWVSLTKYPLNIAYSGIITHSTAGFLITRIAGTALPTGTTHDGVSIDWVDATVSYDNTTGNNKAGSGITGAIALGIVNTALTDGRSGRKLCATNDSFLKPGGVQPPSNVPSDVTETWTDQTPPGATSATNDTRTTVVSGGTTTNAGGKTTVTRKSTFEQAKLATGDYSYTQPQTMEWYERFYPLTGFNNYGVEILTTADASQKIAVNLRVNAITSKIKLAQ